MHVMPDRVQLRSPNFESYINYFALVNFQGGLLGENSLEGRGGICCSSLNVLPSDMLFEFHLTDE